MSKPTKYNQEKTILQKTLSTFPGIFWSRFPFQYFFQLFSGIRSELNSFTHQTQSDKLFHANQVGYPSYTSQWGQVLGCRKLRESLGETGTHANNYNTMTQIRDRCNKISSSSSFTYNSSCLFSIFPFSHTNPGFISQSRCLWALPLEEEGFSEIPGFCAYHNIDQLNFLRQKI